MRVLMSAVALVACAAHAQDLINPAPRAQVEPFTETRYGQTIDDPYRWMEDPARKGEMVDYVRAQSRQTVAKLGALPQRAELAKLVDEAARAGTRISNIRMAGDHLFWRQLDPADRVPKLMVRSAAGTRLLYDPAQESTDAAGPAAINSYNVSPDGKTVALHISFGGAEIGAIRFLDSDTGREKLARLAPVWGEFTAQWLTPTMLTFTRMAEKRPGADDLAGMVAVAGTPGGRFTPILGPQVPKGPDFSPSAFPLIATSEVSQWVVALADNAGGNPLVFVARRSDLATGRLAWRRIATASDRIDEVAALGDAIYMISMRDASDGQVVRLSGAGGARQILPTPTGYVLSGIVAARDGIYFRGRRDGVSHLFWMAGGRAPAREIPLPFEANLTRLAASADGAAATFALAGWTTAPRGYVVRGGKLSPLNVDSGTWSEAAKLVVRRESARSADGTSVPMVIIDHGQKGKVRPTLIEAYGSYGDSTTVPGYDPYYLAWSARGNTMVYCGTRGGSERGRAWHDGGRKENKANAQADLIACGERIVQLGIADPKRLAITGTSAGGLLVPMAAQKRPELFAALVSRVAILNATRLEVAENGANNFGEMGDPRTEAGWRALAAQDSYLNLAHARDLPDTLLTIGLNDHRVAPWMSAKFAARAQEKFGDKRLILVRAETEGGHGIGSARDLQVQEFADIYAFLEHRMATEKPDSIEESAK
ncbi:prolyl oligopeptidase family serine peptidase [Sphingomonas sp. SRS2]|uniref:prolyl oligopeptidase family serine peptidase n=1 Tax=Sphingomonas sp. SRS2 TaxID=133190 RepID=UPI000A6CE359|nr:prolyl oligopeptidase family serine peptidase [Sphingomonas sp. SRS2]